MKRLIAILLTSTLLVIPTFAVVGSPEITAQSGILMEKVTGEILFVQNEHEQLEPASVTKIMTMLLVMEAIDGGKIKISDRVTVSAYAASMGGSQVYLKENEQMTVEEMMKAVAVVSGNDAAVALAEHIAGSESGFVEMMNVRASELGMSNTHFENCNGLPADGHITTAYDIALMSRELMLNHPTVQDFTTIWIDTIRGGEFQLSNTNKLVRYYDGATGLKTGYTDSALFCLSATAERDGMELISVVMKGQTSDERFESAKALLDFGFANYGLLEIQVDKPIPSVAVKLGEVEHIQPTLDGTGAMLVDKSKMELVTTEITVAEDVEAPVLQGQKVGEMTVWLDGEVLEIVPIVASQPVERLSFLGIYKRIMASMCGV